VVEVQTIAHASSMEEQAQALQESHTRTQTLQEELDALRTAFEEAEKQHNKDASGAALRIQELQQALDVAHAALNALEEKHLQAVDEKKTQLEQLAKEHEASLNEATRQNKIISDEAAKELKQLQFRNKITNDALKGSQEQTKDIETQLEQLQEELHALRATSEQRQEEAQNRLNALEKEVAAGHSTIAGEFDDCSLCPSFVHHLFPIGPIQSTERLHEH
jgi:DNA repair exonuclease SbcCD ATPase subunit